MKILLCVIVLTLALSVPVMADDWNQADKDLQAALIVTQLMDWGYTLDIKNHPGVTESNPLLGSNPTDEQINTYFASLIIGNYLLNRYVLPPKIRRAWQLLNIGAELYCLNNCWKLGLKISF